ncbi:MAG: DUF882 domain-containing protein [Proteobacteria bacterium]|jgi:uncharacterized protein YcbK (DUF882 family)|nr:DUF882 domain-containing protein [Alphaproteobacteria bacterium]NCC04151.1 DUF882 domain-containing protein [Pseudomonadota bacterium]
MMCGRRWLGRVFVCLFLAVALVGCGGSGGGGYAGRLVKQYGGQKTRPDRVAIREIVLKRYQTQEKINVTYYHHGSYDNAAMAKIDKIFRDRATGTVGDIDPELIDYLVDIRSRLGLPPTVVFEVMSGYRTPESNGKQRATNGQIAKESLHTRGWAVDFRIPKVNGKAIAEIAKTMQRGGVSYYPSTNHVHVDLGNIRTWATK